MDRQTSVESRKLRRLVVPLALTVATIAAATSIVSAGCDDGPTRSVDARVDAPPDTAPDTPIA
jgi:uncharacterized protein YgiB involved in biofilm formation